MILHAGLIAAHMGGGWRGALIEGPSGAGKSDLALRCLDQGFRLVADDRVQIWACEGVLYGRAPDALSGRIEVRGLDVLRQPAIAWCRISLCVRCGTPERMPEPGFVDYVGLKTPLVTLALLESSAPARLSRALRHLGGGQ
ncbi:HPr kinase/phosphorylase [Phenylobacterium sp.]|uniref:HPr kinase/phosphorylase n=1 Tax=Phenylobacterium sp. TaxID=1871053 RepID=UPI00286DBAEE|nr:HPr kinase/phosphorylase [Phenylobacterium sp.]